MKLVLVDPPMSSSLNPSAWGRFAFSDITWGYAEYLPSLLAASDQVFLVSAYSEPRTFPMVETVSIGMKPWHLRNIATQVWLHRRLGRAVAKIQPDIIHSSDYFGLAMIGQFSDAQLVLTTPGCICERKATHNPYGPVYTKALEWAVAVLRRRNALILATSRYMECWWRQCGFEEDRVIMIPLPTPFVPTTGGRNSALGKLGWRTDVLHLLVVAQLRQENRVDLAILMAKHFEHSSPLPVQVHVVGDGPLEASLKHQVIGLGLGEITHFHGRVPYEQLPYIYRATDALLMPRRYNAIPRVTQEALGYGAPIVSNMNENLLGFSTLLDEYIFQLDFHLNPSSDVIAHLVQGLVALRKERDSIAEVARSMFDAARVSEKVAATYREAAMPNGLGTMETQTEEVGVKHD